MELKVNIQDKFALASTVVKSYSKYSHHRDAENTKVV